MCYQAKGDLDSAIEVTKKHIEQADPKTSWHSPTSACFTKRKE